MAGGARRAVRVARCASCGARRAVRVSQGLRTAYQPETGRPQTAWVEIAAAGGIVFDRSGRLLMIRRGRPPGAGLWSIPGGKCQPDEPAADACVREVLEETGLAVEVIAWVGQVQRPAQHGNIYLIDDFQCALLGDPRSARAGDDADRVGWFDRSALTQLPLVPGLIDALTSWHLLPR